MPDLFSANGNQLSVGGGEYDAGITPEIDKQIRHMRPVVMKMVEKSAQLRRATGSTNFGVITQMDESTQRPRSYVVPINDEGIHEELAEAVLLKAALGMSGQ